jgi:membrane-associated protein
MAWPAAVGSGRRVPAAAGARAVFAGRFLAVHAVLPIVAGSVRMGYRRFVTAAVVGALTWSALYMAIGGGNKRRNSFISDRVLHLVD